ncbi:recombinase family protein [Staphylococcus saprophyticus]|uniref:recombinase family protein n=2 Tax=Staphylococcus saprophyticus TaxID=29385 RepID=UPI0039FDD4F8
MNVGYARVSSKDQNISRQLEALQKYDCKLDNIYQEKVSGKNIEDRKEFKKALEFVRKDDTFIVEALDRLGRNYDEIIKVIQYLKDKEVQLIVTNMPIMNQAIGNPLLDKFMKDLIVSVLAMVSENERIESKRRQSQGIAIAKEKGIYKGKPDEYSPNAKSKQKRIIYNQVVEQLNNNVPIKQIARDNDISRPTVYKIRKQLEETVLLQSKKNIANH